MRISFLMFLFAAAGLVSCKEYKTTESGLQYKFFSHDENGKKPKEGDVIRMHLQNKTQNDSVLMSTYERGKPLEVQVNKPENTWDLMEGFMMMAEGDSALFLVPADSVLKVQQIPGVKPGDIMEFTVKMVKVMTREEYQKELTSAHDARVESQKPIIEQYIKDKAYADVKTTSTGLQYIITQQGTGPLPAKGSTVKVHYKGYLLNGEVFDESYTRGEPFELMLGAGQVIPGWDEGLTFFSKGGKGTLIIPSYLAYGEQGSGKIPPDAPIAFDIEVVDIKAAPAPEGK